MLLVFNNCNQYNYIFLTTCHHNQAKLCSKWIETSKTVGKWSYHLVIIIFNLRYTDDLRFYWLNLVAPIVTYILGPNTPENIFLYRNVELGSGGELCENITYLGKDQKMLCEDI